MRKINDFEEGYNEGYNNGLKKGYIQAMEDFEKENSRPDYCPKTTPIEEIATIPCQNCPIEGECDFCSSSPLIYDEDFEDDFDEEEYDIGLLYDTENIDKFQDIIDNVARVSGLAGRVRCKCYNDKELVGTLDEMREIIFEVIKGLREFQEKAAVDEMYEYICKNC